MKKPIDKLRELESDDVTLHCFAAATLFFFAALALIFFARVGG